MTAALKSVPLLDEEGAEREGADCGGWGEAQRGLARALQERCQQELASCATSLEEDLALLEEGAAPPPLARLEAAVRYRIERKRLVLRSAEVLGALAAS